MKLRSLSVVRSCAMVVLLFGLSLANVVLVPVSEAFELNCTVNGQSGSCAPFVPGAWYCGAYDYVWFDSKPECDWEGTNNGHCPSAGQPAAVVTAKEDALLQACASGWSWEGDIVNKRYSFGMLSYFQRLFVSWHIDPHQADGRCEHQTNNGSAASCVRQVLCPAGYTYQSDVNNVSYCFRTQSVPDPDKNKGCCNNAGTSPNTSHPISIGTGNKFLSETDIAANVGGLEFRRFYNSLNPSASTVIGTGWQHNYNLSLDVEINLTVGGFTGAALATRGDGRVLKFSQATGSTTWVSDADIADRVVNVTDGSGNVTGHQFIEASSDRVETYDLSGRLISINDSRRAQTFALAYDGKNYLTTVTDRAGRQLQFNYDNLGRIKDILGPDSAHWQYAYDASSNLTLVTTPTNTTRTYAYGNMSYPSALTGITDENGSRYVSYAYDTQGRASSENLWSGANQTLPVNQFTLSFPAAYQTLVTDPLNTARTYQFEVQQGSIVLDSMSQPCTSSICGAYATIKARSYDPATGLTSSTTDFNGNITNYAYDTSRDLETQRVEASNTTTPRTTNTTWNTSFRVPNQRSVVSSGGVTEALTKWTYNIRGQALSRCEIDPAVSGAMSYTCGSSTNAPTGVRQWKYVYCDAVGSGCPLVGLAQTVDGPRTDVSDVTTYTYYQATDETGCATLGGACHHLGDVQKVTNALGQMTTYVSYDKNGRVTRMQDANGTYTDMTYHARGWLLTRTVRANANGTPNSLDATTTFAYDNVGNVTKVTQPDGAYLSYTYDAAHRLTDITDNLSDTIHYTLDAAGNRTDEKTKDPSVNLKRELSRQYDQLNRLTKMLNAASATVQTYTNPSEAPPTGIAYTDGYDGNGNAIYSVDGKSVGTEQQYDPLNRLVKTLQDHAGTGATHDTATQYAYDARNNLRSVIDPDNLTTSYTYDGLNNLTALGSPDTGSTGYTYDAAGNRKTQTDARGVISTYSYDVLNRLAGISYPTASLNVTYAYDQSQGGGCYNVGRLTNITDSSGSTTYCYDQRGNVLKKTQIVNPDTNVGAVTTWAYNLADRVTNMTYPSGLQLTYGRNSIGQITQITYKTSSTSASVTLISAASYYPFGPLNVLTYGNGGTLTRSYDQDYAIDKIVGSGANPLVLDATVDALGNLINASSAVGANPPTQSYQYDPLYRLKEVDAGTSTLLQSYTYGPTGDRTGRTIAGRAAQTYTYTPGTHHLGAVAGVARTYDLDGNTKSDGVHSYTYDDRNRLISSSGGSAPATYQLNGRGERVKKNASLDFAYDESGRLIAEYYTYQPAPSCDPETDGCPVQPTPGDGPRVVPGKDYIYLDSLPIAVVQWSEGAVSLITGPTYKGIVYYVQADQLGTPRQVIQPGATTATDTLVWKWDYFANNSAFGENAPSVQTLTFNLRFPGQYFDSETGLNYNYFRDYEPGTGRYVESDPIGLDGGISTYGYVGGNPLSFRDSLGLCKVEARCNLLSHGPILGKNISHCFLVVTEPGGGPYFYRGGPSSNGGGMGAASSNSNYGTAAGGPAGFGNIVTLSGPYTPRTVDWPTSSTPQTGSTTYINNDKPCTCIKNQINNALQDIQDANTPYNPLTTNSNSVAYKGLQSIGVTPGVAPAPAPGWGIPLPGGGGDAGGQCCDQ